MIGARGEGLRLLNSTRSKRYIQEIRRALKLCKSAKIECKDWGALVLFVEGVTGIHRTTLRRNRVYREMIWTFYIVTFGLSEEVADEQASREILLAKLSKVRGRLALVEGELQKWRVGATSSYGSHGVMNGNGVEHVAFVDTALVLVEVLRRCKGVIELDINGRKILDLSAMPSERVVAEIPRAKAFFEWMREARIDIS